MYHLQLVKSGFYTFEGPINVQVIEKVFIFPAGNLTCSHASPGSQRKKKHPGHH